MRGAYADRRAGRLRHSTNRASRQEVEIASVPNIRALERHERFGPTRRGHEFDFEPVALVDVNHGAEIAPAELVFRQIKLEHDRIECGEANRFSCSPVTFSDALPDAFSGDFPGHTAVGIGVRLGEAASEILSLLRGHLELLGSR